RRRCAGHRGSATSAATGPARLRAQHGSAVLALDRLGVNRLLAVRTGAAMRRLLGRHARATMFATDRIRLDFFLAVRALAKGGFLRHRCLLGITELSFSIKTITTKATATASVSLPNAKAQQRRGLLEL